MKFEVGKYYKTRDGRKALFMGITPHPMSYDRTHIWTLEKESYPLCYHASGVLNPSTTTSSFDIVAPWPEEKEVYAWIWLYNDGDTIYRRRAPEAEEMQKHSLSVPYVVGATKLTGKVVEGKFE